MSASTTVSVYSNAGQTGKTDVLYVHQGQRYEFVRRGDFQKIAVGGSTSSMTLYAPVKEVWATSHLLVFGDQVLATVMGMNQYFPNSSGFVGQFVQFTNRDFPVWEHWDIDLSDHAPNLNDRVTGLVLVNSRPPNTISFPIQFSDLIVGRWDEIKQQVVGQSDRVSIRSGPHVSWAAMVTGNKYVDPSKVYICISTGLWVDLPDPFTKVKASFTTYLALWAENGQLRANFDSFTWWRDSAPVFGAWVSGIMEIASELAWLKLNQITLPKVVSDFNKNLVKKKQKLVDIYTVPGKQVGNWLTPGSHVVFSGSSVTETDVTVISELVKA